MATARPDAVTYWEQAHDAYLTHVGTTFQAGRITAGTSMRESNLWLARAAGLEPGQRVLDAGCGVCGPALDITREIHGLRWVGLNVVGRQVVAAAALIREAGLSRSVRVVQGDYHAPPFAERSFDVVLFLESIGYVSSLGVVFGAARRVLKPGGVLYIKDVFRRDELWADQEREELAEFEQAYAYRTPTLAECGNAVRAAGFTGVRTRDLSDVVSTLHCSHAMFDLAGELTAFGRLHFRRQSCVPIYFGELAARVPH